MKKYFLFILFFWGSSYILQGQNIKKTVDIHDHSDGCLMKTYEYTDVNGQRKNAAVCSVMTEQEHLQIKQATETNRQRGPIDIINTTSHRGLATINVTYIGFGAAPAALTAFQYAVDIWSSQINSNVTIQMNATWQGLATGVLGSAGTTGRYQNFLNAPVANTGYPAALANAIAGVDLNSSLGDINANFNSNFTSWYFGTDANPASNQYDFVSVVLHELGHGLGFQGSAFYNTGTAEGSLGDTIFDRFVKLGATSILTLPNPSTQLGSAIVGGGLSFDGPEATPANFGTPPATHAPAVYAGGSSYSHWSESAFLAGDPNSLMTPQIAPGEANHEIGAITRGAFRDMGWVINNGTTTAVQASVSISGNTNVCSGQSTTFNASPTNGGNKPSYQWLLKRGNVQGPVGRNSSYTASNFENGDEISVRMVSVNTNASPILVTSSALVLVVTPTGAPTVSIVASPSNLIQVGATVTFTATSTIGGAAPTYTWLKNSNVVQTGSSNVYTSSTFSHNDVISVALASNSVCKTVSVVASNAITIEFAVVSAQEQKLADNVNIYPNPSTNALQLDRGNLGIGLAKIKIYDILGKNVMNFTTLEQSLLIDTSKLIKGCYIVEIEQYDTIVRKKIIKQ